MSKHQATSSNTTNHLLHLQPHLLHEIPIKTAASKLPFKRKNPDHNPNPVLLLPKSAEAEILPPPPALPSSSSDPDDDDDSKPPPFKFHRIWSESDEIRFLQGLLDSSALGLSFPRDLNLFYDRFSQSMPQPYTRSQLSEKLRRLKKKFRVLSSRLSRGLDASHLTPHDRSLLHLSKQLWHPAFAASSPFSPSSPTPSSSSRKKLPPSSTVKVAAAVASPSPSPGRPLPPQFNRESGNFSSEENFHGGGSSSSNTNSGRLGRLAANTVMDVFDRSLDEVRVALARHGPFHPDAGGSSASDQGKERDLVGKWREQRVAELDVLARRLRLVLEHAVHE